MVAQHGAVVCTIVARNYLGQAAVLADSVRRSNPTLAMVTLVVDGREQDRDDHSAGDVMLLDDLDLAPDVLEPMIVMYSVMELATALKPALLSALVRRGYGVAIYLDPDIEVFGALDGVVAAARSGRIGLTPHVLDPVPRDGAEVSERTLMHAGLFNLGFIAVPAAAQPFLDWWHERLRTDAVVDFDEALFTDQRWVDWAPTLFDVEILRDRGLNVAYWNIHERELREVDGTIVVGEPATPLTFFHFSGYDPEQPWHLSRFTGERPRVVLADQPVLRRLCDDHARALVAAGHLERSAEQYGYAALPGGPRLVGELRGVYRDAVIGRLPFGVPPTRPVSDPDSLTAWLTTPVQCGPRGALTPADLVLWRRSDELQRQFASVLGAASDAYASWLDTDPTVARSYARLGLAAPAVVRVPPLLADERAWRVVPVGVPDASFAAGELADRVGHELGRAGLPWTVVVPPAAGSRHPWRRWGTLAADADARNAIICIDIERSFEDRVVQALSGIDGVKVACWVGSGSELPPQTFRIAQHFDEHWAVNEQTASALREIGVAPVRVVDVPAADCERSVAPGWMATEGGGAAPFLLAVDAGASLGPQRVMAAVQAYRTVIGEDDGAGLVLAVCGQEVAPREAGALHYAAEGRADVRTVAVTSWRELCGAMLLATGVIDPRSGPMSALLAADARAAGVRVVSATGVEEPHVGAAGRTGSELTTASTSTVARLVAALGELPGDGPAGGTPVTIAARAHALDAQRAERRVEALEQELRALRATRTFRYTSAARAAYTGARRRLAAMAARRRSTR